MRKAIIIIIAVVVLAGLGTGGGLYAASRSRHQKQVAAAEQVKIERQKKLADWQAKVMAWQAKQKAAQTVNPDNQSTGQTASSAAASTDQAVLPNTGAGQIFNIFVCASAVAALGHSIVKRRLQLTQ